MGEWWGSLWVILRLVRSWNTSGRNKGTHLVEPRESTDEGWNVDSRPSKGVLSPYFLPCVPSVCIIEQVLSAKC